MEVKCRNVVFISFSVRLRLVFFIFLGQWNHSSSSDPQIYILNDISGLIVNTSIYKFFISVLEYVGPKYRTFVANMSIAIFFTLASSLLPWIAYWIEDWRMFTIATSAPLAFAVFTPWFVPESAR